MIIPLSQWQAHGIEVRKDDGETIDPVRAADPDEKVVLDLHIGKVRYNPGPDAGQDIRDGQNIVIKPGAAFRFETVENFIVGRKVFGQVCSRASLTNRGLIVANIKVDPLFQGKLAVTVYNVAPAAIKLPAGEHFCSVFFQEMSSEVQGNNVRTPPGPPSRSSSRSRDFWDRNRQFIFTVVISLIISVAGSLIATSVDNGGSSPSAPKSSSSSHR